MKKFPLISLLGVSMILAGCALKIPSQNSADNKQLAANNNQNQADEQKTDWRVFKLDLKEINGWKSFNDKNLGLSFKIPNDWPEPQSNYAKFDFTDGGYVPYETTGTQIMELGPIVKGGCEGTDCRFYRIEVYPALDTRKIISELQNSPGFTLSDNQSYIAVNGNNAIIFQSDGICGNKSAVIFGTDNTIIFNSKCNESSLDNVDEFKKILSTINLR